MFDACMRPTEGMRSIRQDQLPREARDLIAYLFLLELPVNEVFSLPVDAVEVRIEKAVDNILYGNGGFHQHAGADSPCYFKHRDDEAWALVFAWDCNGDPLAGKTYIDTLNLDEVEP